MSRAHQSTKGSEGAVERGENETEVDGGGHDGPMRLPNGSISSVWMSASLAVDTSFSPWANN